MVIAANCMKPQLKSKVYGKLTFCALSRLSALFAAVPQRLNQELSGWYCGGSVHFLSPT